MRVGTALGLHLGFPLGFAVLLAAAPAAFAAGSDDGCQVYVDAQWQPAKAESMSSCLLRLDAATTVYDAQGFKFGLWGTTLLSADTAYFYSSMDSGGSWQVVGQKAAITPDGASASVPLAAAKPAPASPGLLARISDFFTSSDEAPAADASADAAPTPIVADAALASTLGRTSLAAATGSGSYVPTGQVVSQRPVSSDGEPRNSCNMRIGSRWEVVPAQTLQQCISLFDRSPDQFDANGFKYGYWSGIYLAANRKEVLQSNDSRDWVTVLNR